MANLTVLRKLWFGWGNANIYEINPGAPFSFNLDSNPTFGQVEVVKDIGGTANSNNITVQGNGHLIDSASSFLMNVNYICVAFYFNGSQWDIISSNNQVGYGNTPQTITAGSTIAILSSSTLVLVNKTLGSPTTLQLPTPPFVNTPIIIKDKKGDAAANNITIVSVDGTLIDSTSSTVINQNKQSLTLIFDGIGWDVV